MGTYVLAFCGVSLAIYLVLSAGRLASVVRERSRLARYALPGGQGLSVGPAPARRFMLEHSFLQRVMGPAIAAAARIGAVLTPEGQRERLGQKLVQAGHRHPHALRFVLALKCAGAGASLLAGWLLGALSPPAGVVAAGAGLAVSLIAPEWLLNRMVADRQTSIVKALPDALDLLTASVEAGLTMDGAMARVVANPNKSQLALCEEFARYLQEIRLGASRREALEALGRRVAIGDLQSLVAALLQADALGVGVGTVLRSQSSHLRTRRKFRAQEAAMKAPVKMLFPLVLFVFPSIFIVTLGPAVIKVLDMFSK